MGHGEGLVIAACSTYEKQLRYGPVFLRVCPLLVSSVPLGLCDNYLLGQKQSRPLCFFVIKKLRKLLPIYMN